MSTLAELETRLDDWRPAANAPLESADELLAMAERVLEAWLEAHGKAPTQETREGFRLLALHRQGAQGEPSFNACRETCRELAYRYNLAHADAGAVEIGQHLSTMRRLVQHLVFFISGKLAEAQLGEFCCSSRSLRTADAGTPLDALKKDRRHA